MSLQTVAIVDDDLRVLQVAMLEIEYCGYMVNTFSSPQKFLNCYNELKPSLVLLDIQMPKMNGLECLHLLSTGVHKSPILMFTSINDDQFRKKALELGATAYLLKSEFLSNPCEIIKHHIK